MSLRRRLALLTVVAFACGLLAIGVVVPRSVRNFLTDRLDSDLRDAVSITAQHGRHRGSTRSRARARTGS